MGRGQGNHVSVEFNVLYRVRIIQFLGAVITWTYFKQWHATTSEADEKWTENLLNSKFGGKPLDQVDINDFAKVFGGALRDVLATPPKERHIGE